MPITYDLVKTVSAELYDRSLRHVPADALAALRAAQSSESNPVGQQTLLTMVDSAEQAEQTNHFVCSDAGIPTYFVRIGTLLDRDYDRYCESEHGISGGDMGVLFALRRSGPPWLHVERRPFASRSLTCGSRGRPFTTPVQAGSV